MMKQIIYIIILCKILFSQLNRATDSLALVKLYENTKGQEWIRNDNWLGTQPLETWFGVVIKNNRVDSLKLGSNNLFGEFPNEIGNLSQISYISFTSNKLYGFIPQTLKNLTNLNYLSISRNKTLSGQISTQLNALTSLEKLYIYDNSFTELGDFSNTSLSSFFVDNNFFTFKDIIPNVSILDRYSPQKNYTANIDTSITEENSFHYDIKDPGGLLENTSYQWYNGEKILLNQKSKTLSFESLKKEDASNYKCKVTNTQASLLTLESGSISVFIDKKNGPVTPVIYDVTSTDNQVTFKWKYPDNNDLNNFYIFFNQNLNVGNNYDSIFVTNQRSFIIDNLASAKTYYLSMSAKNKDSKISYRSQEILVSTTLNGHNVGKSFNAELVDHQDQGVLYNDIWGFKREGKDYIIISKQLGFAIYEINSQGKAILRINEDSENNDRDKWGEVRFYKDYVYKSTEVGSLKIFKIDFINFSSSFVKSFGRDAHNIGLYKNQLIVCGGDYQGVQSWDISSPENPISKWSINKYYVHDFTVQNDKIYLAELYNSSFAIYDIKSASVNSLTDDNLIVRHHYENGFTHNIWPSIDGKYIVTADEHDQFDHMQLWNIEDNNNVKNLLKHQEGETGIIHNAFIKGDYIYASYYTRGFVMFDMSDPELIIKVAEYDAFPKNNDSSFEGTWGIYPFMNNEFVALSNIENGLDIVKVDTTLKAGSYEIYLYKKDEPVKENFVIKTEDNKKLKYKIENNRVTMKAVPSTFNQVNLTIPSLNYSKTINYFSEKNVNLVDTIDVLEKNDVIPLTINLYQNYPNPFNPNTSIKYDVPENGFIKIFIYNSLGQRVKKLVNSFHIAKSGYVATWNGKNDNDIELGSGLYFYQILTKGSKISKKMVLLK
jgi:choice-of-anchor B domain-containing protein